ncbi:DNA polymerase [Candidatus Tiddalikarchaeum anstoanum]|nr:DNA polymerase [Candidatus Tiddalikarchaeum anstoanum]
MKIKTFILNWFYNKLRIMITLTFSITDVAMEGNGVVLYGFTEDKKRVIVRDDSYAPYFIVQPSVKADIGRVVSALSSFKIRDGEEEFFVTRVEKVERKILGKLSSLLKVTCNSVDSLKPLSKGVLDIDGVLSTFDDDVKTYMKYLFDKKLVPLSKVVVVGEELNKINGVDFHVKAFNLSSDLAEPAPYPLLCFDIETYNPGGVSDVKVHPITMISYALSSGESGVLTWKVSGKGFAKVFKDEREMLAAFCELLKREKPAFVISYNGDNFDFPYLKERARKSGVDFDIGWDGASLSFVRSGTKFAAKSKGLVHLDLYPFIKTTMSSYLKTDSYTLNSVCEELLGDKKDGFDVADLYKLWDEHKIDELLDYSLADAKLTLRLSLKILPLMFEMTRIVGAPIFDVCRMSYSRLVESLIMRETRNFNEVILRSPSNKDVMARVSRTFKGGFVYEPVPGFYEHIAVFDFRSLYPSIIVAHNVCPTTLNAEGSDVHTSPEILVGGELLSFRFAKSPIGFIPSLVKELIERRNSIKTILKKMDKKDLDYNVLDSRQNAMKILANAMYGYLGFPKSRWYSMECAASITSWGRSYIQGVLKEAESSGLKVLYGDTDSCFFILPSPHVDDALTFAEKVNKSLPGVMELKFEGFYKSGIFVFKKSSVRGAKKKYALCDKNNELLIKGFEFVRRDWAVIAKDLQLCALKKVLVDKDFRGAVKVLKDTISDVKSGVVPLQKFIIKTRMTKNVGSYENVGPHVRAAMKANVDGDVLVEGSMISFVIVKGGGSISDRAFTYENALKKRLVPDYDYYIKNQLIPSVEPILLTLGFKESEIEGKEQKTLEGFF